jgi:hypothetical protein
MLRESNLNGGAMLLDAPGKSFLFAAGIVLVSGLLVPSHAQDATGHVHGTVTDATGAVMPGVTVVLTNKETGVKRMLVADAAGVYSAPRLQTGTYEIVAEQAGFKKSAYPGITVGVGSNLDIKIVMEVGGGTETVSVTDELPMRIAYKCFYRGGAGGASEFRGPDREWHASRATFGLGG